MRTISRHPRAALAGSAALALAGLLAACSDPPTAVLRESNVVVTPLTPPPAERCESYVEIARVYARQAGLFHFCFTPTLRPDLWSADYPDPQRRECGCSAHVE